VECLPRWRRGGVELERIEVWVEGNVVPCTRYFHTVCDAVAEGFPVVGYADEGSLNACEAEALVLQVAALFVYACECIVGRNSCDVGLSPEEYFVYGLGTVGARWRGHVVEIGGVGDCVAPVFLWNIGVGSEATINANVVIGESRLTATPFFEGAGRPSVPFWGPQQGRRVILGERLSPKDQQKCLNDLQDNKDWVIWCKSV